MSKPNVSKPSTSETNPLLEPSDLPYGAPPLDVIKPEHFLPAMRITMAEAKQQIADIKNNPANPSFENTIEALELAGQALSRVTGIFGNLSGANSSEALQAIEEEISVESVKHANDILMDADLFARVKAVHDNRASLKLNPEQSMLLEETYKSFVRSGALLDEEKKQELRAVDEKLAALGTVFKNNTLKATASYEKIIDDEAELAGLPARVKAQYKANAEAKGHAGKWLIRLSPPPVDIAEYAENRALREEIYKARSDIAFGGAFDNRPVVLEIVQQRRKKAELLGYDDYASYVLAERMAKDSKTVMDFLKTNESVYRPAADEFLSKVQDYAQKTDGLTELKPWDMGYYSRKLKEETYKLNLEDLRPYFDLEKVLEGLRRHAEKLFNIDLVETKDKYPVYHEDVKVYEVKDKSSGEMIGLFYADYYARPGAKSNGAWMNTFRNRGLSDTGENEFSLVTNTCNFAKPTPGHPTLLSLDEVRTVFHEFGHGLHALMAKGNYRSLTGTNVKWDFVELPSQLQENWAKQQEVLDTFARDPKTGQPLPTELVKKIHDMENFDAGYMGLRQTFFGLLDMKWHTTDPKTIKSVEDLEDGVISKSWIFPREAGTQSTAFGHLFSGGYAAGYYSYKWAEALEADVFSVFESKGLYDRGTADKLRDTIYARGGTEDPEKIFFSMMGRKLDPAALFRREGLLPPNPAGPAAGDGPANNNKPKKPAPPSINRKFG
jgi:peptidyl-dipeptidase Dcp